VLVSDPSFARVTSAKTRSCLPNVRFGSVGRDAFQLHQPLRGCFCGLLRRADVLFEDEVQRGRVLRASLRRGVAECDVHTCKRPTRARTQSRRLIGRKQVVGTFRLDKIDDTVARGPQGNETALAEAPSPFPVHALSLAPSSASIGRCRPKPSPPFHRSRLPLSQPASSGFVPASDRGSFGFVSPSFWRWRGCTAAPLLVSFHKPSSPSSSLGRDGDVLHWTGLLPSVAAAAGAGGPAAPERIPAVVSEGMGHVHVVQDAVPTCIGKENGPGNARESGTHVGHVQGWHVQRKERGMITTVDIRVRKNTRRGVLGAVKSSSGSQGTKPRRRARSSSTRPRNAEPHAILCTGPLLGHSCNKKAI